MDSRTPDQIVADTALEKAIMDVIEAYDLAEDAFLLDFVVCVELQDIEDPSMQKFADIYRDGYVRTTTAIGLLTALLARLTDVAKS